MSQLSSEAPQLWTNLEALTLSGPIQPYSHPPPIILREIERVLVINEIMKQPGVGKEPSTHSAKVLLN